MPTPYERPDRAAASEAAEQPPRPLLHRPAEGRLVGGVCAGLAQHLGWEPWLIRLGFVGLALAGGAGVVAYLFLWALTPQSVGGVVEGEGGGRARVDPARPVPAAGEGPEPALTDEATRDSTRAVLVGGLLLLAGLVVVGQNAGLDLQLGFLLPLLVVAVGAVIAWSQLDDAQRGRWLGSSAGTRRFSAARLAFGGLLALVGLVVVATRGRSLTAIWDIALASLAVLAGVALILAPWGLRLWQDLRHEQAEAARATERADIAAHLHDSVLQTLALIQRSADDPTTVAQLARAQERELRSWLYAGPAGSDATLAAAVAEAAHEVEDLHGTPVELVVTGDRDLDEGGYALVRAVREALLNAVRHGEPPVTAYVEIGPSGVEAFVRDHGPGFDLDEVPQDRLGVRQSILGRMERHGGTARVRRLDQGTEVALTLPLTPGEGSPSEPEPDAAGDLTPGPDTPTTEQESSHAQP
ncbi:MAG TPA: PspC domain-containing protein [Pedococcus sp.]